MKWISVEDRLPDDAEYYLVCLKRKKTPPRVMQGFYRWIDGTFYIGKRRCNEGEVTHWMSLPDLPKQQD